MRFSIWLDSMEINVEHLDLREKTNCRKLEKDMHVVQMNVYVNKWVKIKIKH